MIPLDMINPARMTEPQKRNRHPDYKTPYRVRNWREYEQSLRARGDITLRISQDAIDTVMFRPARVNLDFQWPTVILINVRNRRHGGPSEDRNPVTH